MSIVGYSEGVGSRSGKNGGVQCTGAPDVMAEGV